MNQEHNARVGAGRTQGGARLTKQYRGGIALDARPKQRDPLERSTSCRFRHEAPPLNLLETPPKFAGGAAFEVGVSDHSTNKIVEISDPASQEQRKKKIIHAEDIYMPVCLAPGEKPHR